VGVGECRKKSGTMCPSYRATGEEMHSTRGRARLLFEMQRGETVRGGWRDEAVHEALELCLSCMGCRAECPVDVDMATYKAEFMAHYHEAVRRPLRHWGFGLIDRWARLGAQAPRLANLMTRREPFATLARRAAHVAPQRRIPALARVTFARRFARRRPPPPAPSARAPRVLLWPDTFTNHFEPGIGEAAVRVIERAGARPELPPAGLCCGRPLYEIGMLDRARAYLRRVLDALERDIRAGVPVLMLEPACASVFRANLTRLLPDDPRAEGLARQTLMLGEWLDRLGDAARLPAVRGRAVVHGHCHHTSVLDFEADTRLLACAGLDCEVLDSGCCGMAGSFGFDRDKYEVSMRCAERVLLPAVRAAAPGTLVLASGYSCREQVEQATGRRPLHLAEVLAHDASRAAGDDAARRPPGEGPR
jgi:Fe-S oxidoreductase